MAAALANTMSSSRSWTLSLSTSPPSPSSLPTRRATHPPHVPHSKAKSLPIRLHKQVTSSLTAKPKISHLEKFWPLLLQCGLALVETPAALAVTGENGGDDLATTLVSGGIVAVLYLFVFPPIIMNWMRLRWYKRKFVEMYFQFLCVFLFFPGLMLWAPFLNFRKFPRDPTMQYPWSTPKDDVPLYKSR